MKKKILQLQVWLVTWLIRLHTRPNIWHKCEIELAELKAKEFMDLLPDRETNADENQPGN